MKKVLKHTSPLSRAHLGIFILVFIVIGGVAIWRSLAAPNPNLPGDLNNDNTVNITDLSILLSDYGSSNSAADINLDGTVNILDLSILLSHYGQSITQKPAIPTGLIATPGDGSVALHWNANPASDQVDTYQVYLNGTNYNLSVTGTSLTVNGLTNGTTYTFRVSAHNSAGYGDYTATPVSATPQGAGGGATSGNGIGLLELGDNLPAAPNPGRYGLVIVSQDDANAACALPSPTRSLFYMNAESVNTGYTISVDWNTANANGWLLKDSSGNLLVNQGYPTNNIGDIGSSGYQQAWISYATSFASAHGCKGVFMDDVLRDIKPLTGVYPAKYPSQSAWQAAEASFVSVIGPALKAQGIYVALNAVGYTGGDGNSNDGTLDVQWWQQVGPSASAVLNENYQQTADGNLTTRLSGTSSYTQNWDGWQRLVATAQNMNRDFIGLTYGSSTNTAIMRYGKGSFLLDWNGGGSVFMFSPTTPVDPWNLAWTSDIGTPTGAKSQIAAGVWTRTYTKGTVYVNTTGATVSVGGHSIASGDAYIGP